MLFLNITDINTTTTTSLEKQSIFGSNFCRKKNVLLLRSFFQVYIQKSKFPEVNTPKERVLSSQKCKELNSPKVFFRDDVICKKGEEIEIWEWYSLVMWCACTCKCKQMKVKTKVDSNKQTKLDANNFCKVNRSLISTSSFFLSMSTNVFLQQ